MSSALEPLRKAWAWAGRVRWAAVYENGVRIGVLLTLAAFAFVTAEQRANDDRDRRLIECLAAYDRASALATAARAELARQDRDLDAAEWNALDGVMGSVKLGDPKTFDVALSSYLDIRSSAVRSRTENEAEREANPVPDPSLSCVR